MVVALLEAQGLPAADLTDAHLEHFFFVGSDGSPTGLVGIEIYGDVALLRSLVVSEHMRNRGLGSALLDQAEHYAASRGVRTLYLLTTTAEAFFKRRGYQGVDRALAPSAIQRTREFATLCPASSSLLMKPIPTP